MTLSIYLTYNIKIHAASKTLKTHLCNTILCVKHLVSQESESYFHFVCDFKNGPQFSEDFKFLEDLFLAYYYIKI